MQDIIQGGKILSMALGYIKYANLNMILCLCLPRNLYQTFIYKSNISAYSQQMAKKKIKLQQPQQPQQPQHLQSSSQISNNNDDLYQDQPNILQFDEQKQNLQILQLIGQYAVNQTNDALRLTWQAFYSLKRKQIQLNKKMMQEINLCKDKNQLQIEHLYNKISQVALATQKSQLLTHTLSSKPLSQITNYWRKVMTQSGILNEDLQEDNDCISKISQFSCLKSQQNLNHLTITILFKQQTKYFTNLQLSLQITYDHQDQQHIIDNLFKLQYKMQRNPASLFTELFDNQDRIKCAGFAREIYQMYCNSVYFYFSTYYTSYSPSSSSRVQGQGSVRLGQKEVNSPSSSDKQNNINYAGMVELSNSERKNKKYNLSHRKKSKSKLENQ